MRSICYQKGNMFANWTKRGIRLKQLRKRRGWTQETLAEKVGVSRVTVARIEIGNRRPSLDLLEKLARVLRVRVEELLK